MFPWLSNVIALPLRANGSVVEGVSSGVLSLTVSDNTTICLLADAAAALPVFAPTVSVTVGGVPAAVNHSLSSSSRVCLVVPPMPELCGGSAECLRRGRWCAYCGCQRLVIDPAPRICMVLCACVGDPIVVGSTSGDDAVEPLCAARPMPSECKASFLYPIQAPSSRLPSPTSRPPPCRRCPPCPTCLGRWRALLIVRLPPVDCSSPGTAVTSRPWRLRA